MPSETMKARGLSPSFFHEEASFPDEGQNGARKPDHMPGYYGFKTGGTMRTEGVASSALENRVPPDSNIANGFDLRNFYLSGARNVNHSSGKHFVGAERAASRSLSSADHDLGARMNLNTDSTSYCLDGNKINLMGAQYENSLFSSSLSDLFSRKLTFPSNNAVYGHSVGAPVGAPHFEDEDTFESLEELEAQTIGNLLPDDDDLLSGVTDGFSSGVRLKNGDDNEDLDLFSNVGGLELGEDGSSLRNSEFADINGYNQFGLSELHPSVKHPSRTLFVRNINSNVDDSELRALFEQYGDIHVLYTACKHRGFVMISYYDLRAACNAMKALQSKSLRRRKLDIHFSIPKENPAEKDINQGTVVVFNHDASVSNDDLREIFGVYGEIKEVYETPNRIHHKFVEFYDVRAAESALRALNRSDISGKQIKLEPGQSSVSKSASMSDMYRLMQPYSSELEKEVSGLLLRRQSANSLATGFPGPLSLGGTTPNTDNGNFLSPHSNGGPITPLMDNGRHPGVSSSLSNSLSPLMRIDHQGIPSPHPHSLPEYHDSLANWTSFGSPSTISARPPEMIDNQQFRRLSSNGQSAEFNEVFGSSGNGSCPPPGRQYIWNNTHHSQSQALAWPNSPTFANGMSPGHRQLHGVPRAPSHMLNSVLPINNHHVGSAPSVNPSLWDRRCAYVGESPDANVFHPGSLGNMRVSGNSPHPLDFVPHNIFSQAGGNSPHHQRCMVFPPRGQVIPMMSSFESPNERTRNRRNEGGSGQGENKKQFELDVDRILRGDDKRTTLMIKNIPNKYTSKMLLSAIDEQHRGTYDFIYLPIDFKNKCNVGYAFINMIDPSLIVPFYQTLNGKKWEKFNSEKVASLAYARIQGKAALIAHFQNSSLMNEDKRCRPILFHTDGPNAGDQVPFPMGSNIRPRPSKVRASSTEENSQEMLPNSLKGEDYFNGDSSSGSGKDSD